MGFFGSLFGKNQRKEIRRSTAAADALLTGAEGAARSQFNQGFDQQAGMLEQGYNQARGTIGAGYDQARGDLTGQYGSAENALTDARSYVEQALAPFIASGQGAQTLYDRALGLQGADAAQSFYLDYAANDPFRQFNEDMANKSLARSFNASGALGSGRAGLAASRANLERGSQDLNRYLDRLASQGQQGGQYATRVADAGLQTGMATAKLRQGLGNQLSNLETNRGTQLGNLDYGYGVDRGNIAANRAGANSDLTYGLAQQRANLQIGKGNSIANTQTQSVNNLLGLGAAVIGAWGNRPR